MLDNTNEHNFNIISAKSQVTDSIIVRIIIRCRVQGFDIINENAVCFFFFFFLEHAGELRIIKKKKRGKDP